MKRLTPDEKFYKYINQLRKLAWSFHLTTNIEMDELFGEACLSYCEALRNFNPERSQFSTYLWYCVNSHLINYINKVSKYIKTISLEEINYDNSFDEQPLINQLSKEATIIVELILNNVYKYSSITIEEAKKQIAEEMIKINGFTMKHVWIGMNDLKLEFNLK